MTIAAQDINTYLQANGMKYKFTVNFYDTKLDPATAVQDFAKSINNKSPFVIGPQSSAELAAIIPKADSNHVIVVSQGSTAGSLAMTDPVFRFCPPDHIEGSAMANTIYKSGIRGLVTIARNDAGNLGLQTAVSASFTSSGGQVTNLAAYSTTATNYSTQLTSLHNQLATYISTYGAAKVGVYLASFDEFTEIFTEAAADPVLASVHWYGGDGVVLSAALTADAAAADFAIQTNFFAPNFGLPASLQSKWQPIADKIKAITGIEPDAFALSTYDAMWVIEKTVEAEAYKNVSFAQLETAFTTQADSYSGITGPTALDKYGDRASGTFDYYGISKSGSTYSWVQVGESD
jgi:branched-chain amino acid transport system substrate-binding protein